MSTHESVLPPALVLGSGITALGVVRGLGRRGIPRHVLSADPVLVRASRWYRPPPGGQRLRELSDLAGYLRSLPLEGGVLIPTSDHAALAAAGLPPDLAARFPTSQAPASVLAELLDKEKLRRLLAEHDVPHPRTIPVDGPLDLEDLGDVEVERLFVKPRDSQEFSRRLGVKALRAGSREALRTALDRVRREGLPVVLQEYVPGPSVPASSGCSRSTCGRGGRWSSLPSAVSMWCRCATATPWGSRWGR
jgi:predicted ATP-grasp superfamily ATP-dependent carboligase